MTSALWTHLLRNPRTIGSVTPSSAALARAMAKEARSADHVLELGAGTGPVTAALLQELPVEAITSVELQPQLSRHLKKRFPTLQVVEGCAVQALQQARYSGQAVVVSSLPFRSLPQDLAAALAQQAVEFLARHSGSRWVQFTYRAGEPFSVPPGFTWKRSARVWANVPPARVWVLAQDLSQ